LSAFDSQTVYAAFLDSLGVSHDSGASWEYFSSPGELLTLTLQPGKIDRLIGGHVNRGIVTISTTDLQWQYQNNGLNANAVLEIAHSSDNEKWDYAATYGGLYMRSSREQVWDLINPRPAEAVSVRSGKNAAVFVGFDRAIGRSSDGGVSWDYIDISHDEKPWGVSSLATSLAQPEIVYAGLYNYIDLKGLVLKSNNSGDSYEVILDTATPVNCVHIAQSDPNTLYVGTGSFYSPVMPGSLFKSNDNGMTWTQQNTQLSVINSIIADSKNADHIYAACGAYDYSFSGILHSIDSGSSWVRLNNGLPFKKQLFAGLSSSDFAATTLCLDPSVPEHLYCALYDQGVYFSPNSGNYWTRIGLSEYVLNTLTSSAGSDTTSVGSHVARSAASESILLNAGTDSGMYQYRLAGNGIVTGTVRSSITGDFLDKAEINTDSGAACLSSQGYYVLLLPAGAHTLQTILNGYENNAVDHISIAAGETLSHDIFLQPAGNTINKTPCLLSGFGETEKNHELFSCVRALRDSALAKHAIGVIMIKWYYQVSALLSGSVK
ncbi:MAG: hypothetical protein GY868_19985, partial [Deltaproteobacteria bacterium]|nr:hypothetical protein [Deltaproteobacteria bacterium]